MDKICPICNITPRHTTKTGKISQYCKPCGRRSDKAWKTNNPERWSTLQWRARLKRVFRITPEEFEKMLIQQAYKCKICRVELDITIYKSKCGPTKVCIDHDHLTGSVRALLCNLCNVALGSMRDDPKLLRDAADYLETYGK